MESLAAIGPEVAVAALALFVLLFDLVWPKRERLLSWLSACGLGAVLLWTALAPRYGSFFYDTFIVDPVSIVFKQLFLAGTAVVVLISLAYLPQFRWKAEFVSILLIACTGMMLVSSANELITLYVSLELVTISFFILASYKKADMLSTEAGLKLYLQGFVSSGVLIYGLSLLYGFSGSTYLGAIAGAVAGTGLAANPLLIIALVLVIAGFGFKLSFVPFHMWVPDVYQGAPTPVTAFLSIGSKTAGFAAFLRVVLVALGGLHTDVVALFGAAAVVTMTLGNLIALPQTNIKRLLAYSTISQVGYMFLGLVMADSLGVSALLFYLLAYMAANLLAFAVITAFYVKQGSHEIADYEGLFSRSPLLAAGMAVALLSLGGIPPLAGFVAKFYLFSSAAADGFLFLAAAAVVNTLVSMYYYLNVIRRMFWGGTEHRHGPLHIDPGARLAIIITLALVVLIGIYPAPFLAAMQYAASFFI